MKKEKLFITALMMITAFVVGISQVKATPIEIGQDDFTAAKSSEGTEIKGITYNNSGFFPEFTLAAGEYTLAGDVSFATSESIVIPTDTTVVLDMNGKTLTQGENSSGNLINSTGDFTIKGNGTIATFTNTFHDDYTGEDYSFTNIAIRSEAGTLTVENGSYAGGLYVMGSTATINGGTFGQTTIAYDSTATINDGTFNSGITNSGAKKMTIKGGVFAGPIAGLTFYVSEAKPDINISGGTFKVTGSSDAKGGIFAMLFDGSTTYDFSTLLADGYKYSPAAETKTEDGESPGEVFAYLDAKEIKVVSTSTEDESSKELTPTTDDTTKANVVADDSNSLNDKQAATAVLVLLEEVKNGNKITGMSDELVSKINAAIANGDTVKIEMGQDKIETDKLDATVKENMNKTISKDKNLTGAKILGYYDISLFVKVNGTKLDEKVTELKEAMEVSLDVTDLVKDLPAVEKDKVREFYVVKNHNGVTSIIKASLDTNNILKFKNGEFSEFAIIYNDISNPNTVDNVNIYMILGAISIVGLSIIVIRYFSKKSLKK